MKEAILEAFHTPIGDIMTRKVFDRVWMESLRHKVKRVITNRRGRFTTIMRTKLWHQLGVPKPQEGTPEEIAAWKRTLEPFKEGNRWRWNGDDPFGSDALCKTITFVKFGKKYTLDEPLRLIAKQLAWFAYVMYLAVDGDWNMKESEMRLHRKELKGMKEFVIGSRHLLTRIELVLSKDVDVVQDVLSEDVEED